MDSVSSRGATTANTLTLNGGINTTTETINFTVGSTGTSGKVQIGNSGTATPDLFVLDNGTADPTGVNGGMYYNTSSAKFRCFEASAWKDCDTGVPQSSIVTKTEPSDLTNTSTTLQNTNLSFAIGANETWSAWYALRSFNSITSSRDVSFAISAPAGASCYLSGGALNQSGLDATACAAAIITPLVGNEDELEVLAVTVVNGGTAGTVTLQYANNGATGTAHVDAGSSMKAFKNQGSDVAEVYYTTDDQIGPGSVVTIDSTIEAGVKGADHPYDSRVIGVLSTLPGLVLGDSKVPAGTRPVYLALSGRVPVKVSTENGIINAGDYLTTSGTSGVAMKATKAGAIIGTAMTSFNGEGIGQVLVFVKNGSAMGSLLTERMPDGVSNLAQPVGVQVSTFSEETATGSAESQARTEMVTETNILDQVTKIVSDLFKETIEFLGNVIFHADVTFQGRPTFNTDTAGFASVRSGQDEVRVNFDREYDWAPVVTISVNLFGGVNIADVPEFAIYDLNTKGFKIRLARTTSFDLQFSWMALNVKDAKTSKTAESTPSPTPPVTGPKPPVSDLAEPLPALEVATDSAQTAASSSASAN